MTGLNSNWGGYVRLDGARSAVDPNDKGLVTLRLLHYGPWNGQSGAITSISNLQQYTPTGVRDNFNVNIIDYYSQHRSSVGQDDVHK